METIKIKLLKLKINSWRKNHTFWSFFYNNQHIKLDPVIEIYNQIGSVDWILTSKYCKCYNC